jgi:hypothetical protein
MRIKHNIIVTWKDCDKGCCEDYRVFQFSGSPGQAITFAQEVAKLHPTTFRIRIYQYDDEE